MRRAGIVCEGHRRARTRRIAGRGLLAAAALLSLAGCQEALLGSEPSVAIAPQIEAGPGVIYSLPKALLPVTLARAPSPSSPSGYAIDMQFGAPIVFPDQAFTFNLAYAVDSYSSDTVRIKTSADGLLQQISTSSKDERQAVAGSLVALAGELAKAAATAAAPGFGVPGVFGPSLQVDSAPAPVRPFELTVLVDPYDPEMSEKVAEQLFDAGGEGVTLSLVASPISGETRSAEDIRAFCAVGACYRRPAPVTLKVYDDATRTSVQKTTILPNGGVVGRLDFERRAFVENKATANFDNGMLVEIFYEDPSSSAAIANAPVNLVKDIVSIPAAAFGAQTSQIDQQRELLAAEQNLINQRIQFLEAQEKLRQARAEADAAQATAAAE